MPPRKRKTTAARKTATPVPQPLPRKLVIKLGDRWEFTFNTDDIAELIQQEIVDTGGVEEAVSTLKSYTTNWAEAESNDTVTAEWV